MHTVRCASSPLLLSSKSLCRVRDAASGSVFFSQGKSLNCFRSKLTLPEYVVVAGKTVRSERQSKRMEEKYGKVRAQRGDGAGIFFTIRL